MRSLALLALVACTGVRDTVTDAPPPAPPPAAPAPLPTASPTAAAAINATGRDLHATLVAADPTANAFFSPASVYVALAMTAAGAGGDTLAELRAGLHLPEDGGHEDLGALIRAWNATGDEGPVALSVANRLWVQDGLPIGDDFARIAAEVYGAPVAHLDFAGAGDAARTPINDWVAARTNDRIRDLLPPGSITTDSRIILTNAVYFRGDWATPFAADQTTEQAFIRLDGSTVEVPLMHAPDASVPIFRGEGVAVALLPYAGDTLDMVVVLPDDPAGLPAVEARLEELDAWIDAARPASVDLWLPRFEVSAGYDLAHALKAMGMASAFDRGADFTPITTAADVHITGVFHKAFVTVDETGTEAAGATGAVMGIESVSVPVLFRVDHPFFFAIRDRPSGALLFAGRLTDPRP